MPDTETGHRPDIVDVAEAARRLNVSHDAIRSRLRRGTLEGEKRGGTWYVTLPADADGAPGQASGQDTTPATDATGAALVISSSAIRLPLQDRGVVCGTRSGVSSDRANADIC